MDKIYFIETAHDNGERICDYWVEDHWVEDIGYFTSFEEAKANAKEILIGRFNCPEDTITETEYGFESECGRCYGTTVCCGVYVRELTPFKK